MNKDALAYGRAEYSQAGIYIYIYRERERERERIDSFREMPLTAEGERCQKLPVGHSLVETHRLIEMG